MIIGLRENGYIPAMSAEEAWKKTDSSLLSRVKFLSAADNSLRRAAANLSLLGQVLQGKLPLDVVTAHNATVDLVNPALKAFMEGDSTELNPGYMNMPGVIDSPPRYPPRIEAMDTQGQWVTPTPGQALAGFAGSGLSGLVAVRFVQDGLGDSAFVCSGSLSEMEGLGFIEWALFIGLVAISGWTIYMLSEAWKTAEVEETKREEAKRFSEVAATKAREHEAWSETIAKLSADCATKSQSVEALNVCIEKATQNAKQVIKAIGPLPPAPWETRGGAEGWSFLKLVGLGAIVAVAAVGGYVYYVKKQKQKQQQHELQPAVA